MKHLATILAAFVGGCTLPAPAVEWDGNTIKLTAEEAAKCRSEGGCVVITVDMLRAVVRSAESCRRNSI